MLRNLINARRPESPPRAPATTQTLIPSPVWACSFSPVVPSDRHPAPRHHCRMADATLRELVVVVLWAKYRLQSVLVECNDDPLHPLTLDEIEGLLAHNQRGLRSMWARHGLFCRTLAWTGGRARLAGGNGAKGVASAVGFALLQKREHPYQCRAAERGAVPRGLWTASRLPGGGWQVTDGGSQKPALIRAIESRHTHTHIHTHTHTHNLLVPRAHSVAKEVKPN